MSGAASFASVLRDLRFLCACRIPSFRLHHAVRLAQCQPLLGLARSHLLPLDFPVSIKELALRPLKPRLLRRALLVFLISLFRRMTGVSANGKAIFVASKVVSYE